jgi:hypothetical protein
MSQRELDQAVKEIRDEVVEDGAVRDVAKRVFASVFDSTLAAGPVDRIRGCADFRALMAEYRNRTLSPSRTLLLEDHTRQCVHCRKALQEMGNGAIAGRPFERDIRVNIGSRSPVPAWAFAAALTIGIGVGVVAARNGLLPGQHAVRATVAAVDGGLYRITKFGETAVAVGDMIRNGDELRTAKGSRAILRLVSGSRLELGERSSVSISGGWRGAAVDLEQGRLIVDSQTNRDKTYVSSGSLVIPVKEAILAIDGGVKGSRIAVAKGLVQVQQGDKSTEVSAGQQFTSDSRIGIVPIFGQFAWSQNAGAYAALLNELSSLQKQFQSIPSSGLRYSSSLAKYVPGDTVIYAAIPNLGGTLTEAKRMFDERLSQSEVLREWWSRLPASHAADLDRALTQLASVSQYLGDELVIAVRSTSAHQNGSPVFVAEVRQSGLNDYLQQNVPSSAGLQIVTATSGVGAGGKDHLFVGTENGIVVASPDLAELQMVQAIIRGTAVSTFPQTPFYGRIARSYGAGVGYLVAADMEHIEAGSVTNSGGPSAGLSNVQYLVLERRDTGGTETRATLSFVGEREGIASWLGSPGPIGSMGFVSPEASFAVALVMKNPRDIAAELISFASQGNPQFLEQVKNFESGSGMSLLDDVATPLGGDATFAVDGPLLPVPSWKFAVEVNDSGKLQNTVATLVDHYNQTPAPNAGKLILGENHVDSRTFYSIGSEKAPAVTAYYTFVDGYLLAGVSEAALSQAIQNRQSGYTLASSSSFRALLPTDNSTDFSAILYNNLGPALGPVASQLKGSNVLTPAQQQSMAALAANATPSLICLYGEAGAIVAATRSTFLGFNLGTLAAIQQGKPILPLIVTGAQAMQPGTAGHFRQSRN